MSYKSPIELITSQTCSSIEDAIYRSVLKVGIDVDKEELLKALEYDRGQYQKGYADRDSEIIRCKDCKHGEPCNEGDVFCTKDIGTIESSVHKPDWFCANGERSET